MYRIPPFVPKNALGWHEPSPFEEDAKLTYEFARACNATEHGISDLPCNLGFSRNEYGISIEAVAPWVILAYVQMQLVLAGEQVGAILDLRSKAPPATKPDEKDDDGNVVNAGENHKDGKVKENTINNFLPLAALEDCVETFMVFTGGFDLAANWKPLIKAASTLN